MSSFSGRLADAASARWVGNMPAGFVILVSQTPNPSSWFTRVPAQMREVREPKQVTIPVLVRLAQLTEENDEMRCAPHRPHHGLCSAARPPQSLSSRLSGWRNSPKRSVRLRNRWLLNSVVQQDPSKSDSSSTCSAAKLPSEARSAPSSFLQPSTRCWLAHLTAYSRCHAGPTSLRRAVGRGCHNWQPPTFLSSRVGTPAHVQGNPACCTPQAKLRLQRALHRQLAVALLQPMFGISSPRHIET